MSSRMFYGASVGFVLGVLCASLSNLGIYFGVFLCVLGGALMLVYWLYTRRGETSQVIVLLSIVLIFLGLGMIRFDFSERGGGDPTLDAVLGEHTMFEGFIADEPRERENSQQIVFHAQRIHIGSTTQVIDERVLISTNRLPRFSYGDMLRVQGTLLKPEVFNTDTGRAFDYVNFLRVDDIAYRMRFVAVQKLEGRQGNWLKRFLFDAKQNFLARIERVIPQPQSALLGGLVVGAEESLGSDILDDFRTTGIIHIVVLSGYNITIVAESIMRVFGFLPYVASIFVGGISIVLFALLTGGGATIVRASLMTLLVLIARLTGRTYDILRALMVAGIIMILHNPYIVAFDPSFQLSFVATLGLIWLAPLIEARLHLVPTRWGLREAITATIATQLFVLPLLLYSIGELSLVALFVNVLILPFVPLTMLFGFLTGVFGFLGYAVSFLFAVPTHVLLTYMLTIVEWFASIPFASVTLPTFPVWIVVGVYGVYASYIYLANIQVVKENTTQ